MKRIRPDEDKDENDSDKELYTKLIRKPYLIRFDNLINETKSSFYYKLSFDFSYKGLKTKLGKIVIYIFNVNFNANKRNQCSLYHYHQNTWGENCQYVGFLNDEFEHDDYITYSANEKRNTIFVNTCIKDLIEKTRYYHVNDQNKYNKEVLKDQDLQIIKLDYAQTHFRSFDDKTYEELSNEIRQRNSITGEFVIVSNIFIPVCKVNFEELTDSSKEYYIRLFMNSLNNAHTNYKSVFAENYNIIPETLTLLLKVGNDIQNLGIKLGNDNDTYSIFQIISELMQESYKLFGGTGSEITSLSGGFINNNYKMKYMKYKKKYLNLLDY